VIAGADGSRNGHVVACVGETMAALVPAAAEPLETADTLRIDVAGAESNVAIYLADHGIPARWVSRLGDDAFGRRVARTIADAGVDISGVRFDPDRPTGLLFKDPGPDGTRVTYYRRGSAASAMGPDLLNSEALRTATVWHFSGVTPALSPDCLALTRAALTAPRPSRIAVSFDVNYRPALWPEPPGKLLQDLADRADIAFVGLDEARALWGADALTAADVRALLPTPRILVVKDGATAATAFADDRETVVPPRRADVVEPVGAGDAFAAGFLAALLRGDNAERRDMECCDDMESCLRLGHLTAASALSVTGDHGPLPPPEMQQRLLAASPAEWMNG
jgi:2-dehydro-3-deoxygluconokinase